MTDTGAILTVFFVEFGKRKIKNITEIEVEDFILNAIGEFSLTSKAFSNLRTIVYGVFKRAKKSVWLLSVSQSW